MKENEGKHYMATPKLFKRMNVQDHESVNKDAEGSTPEQNEAGKETLEKKVNVLQTRTPHSIGGSLVTATIRPPNLFMEKNRESPHSFADWPE